MTTQQQEMQAHMDTLSTSVDGVLSGIMQDLASGLQGNAQQAAAAKQAITQDLRAALAAGVKGNDGEIAPVMSAIASQLEQSSQLSQSQVDGIVAQLNAARPNFTPPAGSPPPVTPGFFPPPGIPPAPPQPTITVRTTNAETCALVSEQMQKVGWYGGDGTWYFPAYPAGVYQYYPPTNVVLFLGQSPPGMPDASTFKAPASYTILTHWQDDIAVCVTGPFGSVNDPSQVYGDAARAQRVQIIAMGMGVYGDNT